MPITKQCELKVVFNRLDIDAVNGYATAYFTKYLDGVQINDGVSFNVGPDIVGPLLTGVPSDPTLTRQDDIALAVYNLAIAQGWFTGTVS